MNDFNAGTAHGYYVEIDGNLISYAQSSAENTKTAMLVSVMTHKSHRKNGFASTCIKTLCEELVSNGKSLCLYYKNPEAGKIYKKIGFNEIGFWSIYIKS